MSSPWTPGRTETRKSMSPQPAAQPESPVLGDAMLRDVEFGHDFDARDDGRLIGRVEGAERAGKHAVDAEIDGHAVGGRVDVNVARLLLQGRADHLVDEPDNRRRVAPERLKIDGLAVAFPGFADDGEPEFGGDVVERLLAVVALLEQLLDSLGGARDKIDFALRQHAKLLLKLEIVRPAGGDHEHVALGPERRHAKPPRVGGGQAQKRFRRYSPARKVVEGQTEFGGKLRSHAWPALLCLDAGKAPLTPALSHPHPLADAETLKCQLVLASWRGEGVDRGPGPTAKGNSGVPSPLGERDRVRGDFAKHWPEFRVI